MNYLNTDLILNDINFNNNFNNFNNNNNNNNNNIIGNESPLVIVSVAFFNQKSNSKSMEFKFLSNQLLTSIRDCITCPSDYIRDSETNQYLFSGYFFIENIFYDDKRKPENKQYSK